MDRQFRLADSCKHSSVNQMAAGLRLPRSIHDLFSSFSYFSNILSEVNINIFSGTMCPTGPYKAFWYTGSAFTKSFNHFSGRGMFEVFENPF